MCPRGSTRVKKEPNRLIEHMNNIEINRYGDYIEINNLYKQTKRHKTLIKPKYLPAYTINIPKSRKAMLKIKYQGDFIKAEQIKLTTIQKHDQYGNVLKFKARLVALGNDQRENEYGMSIYLLDFKGAYLHAK